MPRQTKEWRGHISLQTPKGVKVELECWVVSKKDGGVDRLIRTTDLERLFKEYGIRDYKENLEKFKSDNFKSWVHSDAFNKSVFTDYMKFDNEFSQILFSGLLLVGVVPLVDEVTGYQNARPNGELMQIFNEKIEGK